MADELKIRAGLDSSSITSGTRDIIRSFQNVAREVQQIAKQTQNVSLLPANAVQQAQRTAREMIDALEAEFTANITRLQAGQLRGFISEADARAAGKQIGDNYRQGLVTALSQAGDTAGRQAIIAQIRQLDSVTAGTAANLARTGAAARQAGVGLNALRGPLTSIAAQAASANPAMSTFVSIIGSLALGTGLMVGVLAGMAALALAWKAITKESREATEATKKNTEELQRLVEQRRIAALGPGGGLQEQADKADAEIIRLVKERTELEEVRRLALSAAVGADVPEGFLLAARDAQRKINEINRQAREQLKLFVTAKAAANEEIATAARTAEEALERAGAAADDKLAAGLRVAEEAAAALSKAMQELDGRMAKMTLPASLTNGMVITVDAIERLLDKMEDLEARTKAFTGQGGTLLPLSSRGVRPPADIGAPIPDLSIFDSVKGAFNDLGAAIEAKLTPAALAAAGAFAVFAPIVKGAGEVLRPAIEDLIKPLVDLGREIATVLQPVLQALAPVVAALTQIWKGLSLLNPAVTLVGIGMKLLVPILHGVTVTLSYFQEGLGRIIRAIGNMLNVLPGSPGASFVRAGQEMIDAAKAARAPILEAAEEAAQAIRAFANSLDGERQRRELDNKLRGVELNPQQVVSGLLNDLKNTFPILFEKIFAGVDLSNNAAVRQAIIAYWDSVKNLTGVQLQAALLGAPLDGFMSWLGLAGDALNALDTAARDTATSLRGVPEVFNFTLASLRAAGTREFIPLGTFTPPDRNTGRTPPTGASVQQDNRVTVASGAVVVQADPGDVAGAVLNAIMPTIQTALSKVGAPLTSQQIEEVRRGLKPSLVAASQSKGEGSRIIGLNWPG